MMPALYIGNVNPPRSEFDSRPPGRPGTRTWVAALLLGCAVAAPLSAQDPVDTGPAAGDLTRTLQELMVMSLRSSPAVLTAEAKLQVAEAELRQAKLAVAERLSELYYGLQSQRRQLDVAREKVEHAKARFESGRATREVLADAEQGYEQAEAVLFRSAAAIRRLTGEGPGMDLAYPPIPAGRAEPVAPVTPMPPVPGLPERLQKALDAKVGRIACVECPLRDAVEMVKQHAPLAIPFVIQQDVAVRVDLDLEGATVREVLLAMADQAGVCFVLRDYGLLVTSREHAATMTGPSIPPEATARALSMR